MFNLVVAAGGLSVAAHPDANGLPGSKVFGGLVNGLFFWALLACLAAIFAGVAIWAVAGHGNNPHHASRGKMAVLLGAGGAFLVGAGPAIVNFFATHGHSVH